MQGILELDIVSGSGVGHGTPDFDALSERSNHRRDSQSTVAGPPTETSIFADFCMFFGHQRVDNGPIFVKN